MIIGVFSVLLSACFKNMLLADRGYDADWIRELARQQGTWRTFRRNEIAKIRSASPNLYRARNHDRRFFNKIKQCRRVATTIRQTPGQLSGVKPRINPNLATR